MDKPASLPIQLQYTDWVQPRRPYEGASPNAGARGSAHAWSPAAVSEGVSRRVWFSLCKYAFCAVPRFLRQTGSSAQTSALPCDCGLNCPAQMDPERVRNKWGCTKCQRAVRLTVHKVGDMGKGQPGPAPRGPAGQGQLKGSSSFGAVFSWSLIKCWGFSFLPNS